MPDDRQWDVKHEYVEEQIRDFVPKEQLWDAHAVRCLAELVPVCVDGVALKHNDEGCDNEPDNASHCCHQYDSPIERVAVIKRENVPIKGENAELDEREVDSEKYLQRVAELLQMSIPGPSLTPYPTQRTRSHLQDIPQLFRTINDVGIKRAIE